MRKIVSLAAVLFLMLSLCACSSLEYKKAMTAYDDGDYKSAREMFAELGDYENSAEMVKDCDYELACELMDDGEYGEAAALFEDLNGYKDSADRAEECYTKEIDVLVQGDWHANAYSIEMSYQFNNGRFKVGMSAGTSALENEGTYRIDTDSKEIYVCYDYIISTSGKTPNTEEKLLFTYTYDGSDFVLKNAVGEIAEKD